MPPITGCNDPFMRIFCSSRLCGRHRSVRNWTIMPSKQMAGNPISDYHSPAVTVERRSDMLKVSRFMAVALVAAGLSSVAAAQGFDNRRLYFGGGLSQNSISNFDNATGFQVFGGYNFPALARNFYVDAEAGYMDTGKFKRSFPIIGTVGKKGKGGWGVGGAR